MKDIKRPPDASPCGNFTAAYRFMCDYLGVDFMEDVAWVSVIYLRSVLFISADSLCGHSSTGTFGLSTLLVLHK